MTQRNKQARLPLPLILTASSALIILLILPTIILVAGSLNSSLTDAFFEPVTLDALRLSLLTTSISLVVIILFGIPTAYLMARYEFRGKRILDTLLDLPVVLPPSVAGVALLLAFGRRSFIGQSLADMGITISFTSLAVIIAQVFVAAPLFIRSMKVGLVAADKKQLEAAALSLGANRWRTFSQVSFPLSMPAFIEGCVLSWARAIGEFGATLVFAGSLQGRTQTMPLAIYATLEQDLDLAIELSAILALAAFALLIIFRFALKTNRYET